MPHLPLPPPPRLAHVVCSLPGNALFSCSTISPKSPCPGAHCELRLRSLQHPKAMVASRRVSEAVMEVSAGWTLSGYTGAPTGQGW